MTEEEISASRVRKGLWRKKTDLCGIGTPVRGATVETEMDTVLDTISTPAYGVLLTDEAFDPIWLVGKRLKVW